jgi:hypothetical protein
MFRDLMTKGLNTFGSDYYRKLDTSVWTMVKATAANIFKKESNVDRNMDQAATQSLQYNVCIPSGTTALSPRHSSPLLVPDP